MCISCCHNQNLLLSIRNIYVGFVVSTYTFYGTKENHIYLITNTLIERTRILPEYISRYINACMLRVSPITFHFRGIVFFRGILSVLFIQQILNLILQNEEQQKNQKNFSRFAIFFNFL